MIRVSGLIERDSQLQALETVATESTNSGRAVLISGEAGFGKTSLLREFLDRTDHRFSVLAAACEPLGIPAAFSPLFDLLDDLPEEVRRDIRSGVGRPAVYAGMLDVLKNDRVILVLEDMHWADEATLGLVRYLGRRIGVTGSVLVVTYRSEEVDPTHPLRLVIADLGASAFRLDLPPLSLTGVTEMTEGLDLDPVQVHAATLGNPFFVDEIARHPDSKLPPTIENAILASAAQLPTAALELLYMVSLSPEGLDLDLVAESFHNSVQHLDHALQRRLLVLDGDRVSCRHDLVRESLLQAMPPLQKRVLHAQLLTLLEDKATGSPNIARLAYHSVGAGIADKAASFSLEAAKDAARLGAHRQAAFHFSNAFLFREAIEDTTLEAALLEAAKELCLINHFAQAVELSEQRLALARTPLERAAAHAWVGFFQSRENDWVAARREAQLAMEILESQPPSEELALALAITASVELVEGDMENGLRSGEMAVALARTVDAPQIEVQAMVTVAWVRTFLGDPEGERLMEEAVELGIAANLGEFAARALNGLAFLAYTRGHLEEARDRFERMIEYCLTNELDAWYIAGVSTRAWINMASGRWAEADEDLEVVLWQKTCVQTEVETLTTAAMLRARRGDPGTTELIEAALARIEGSTDRQLMVIGCALAMEGAWLGVHPDDDAARRYAALIASPALAQDARSRGALAFWAARLGLEPPPGRIPGPAGLEWSGAVKEAAKSWEEKGFLVEAAITKAVSPDADLDSLFVTLTRVGADGVLRGLRRELQRRGVSGIPRGERPATRESPAGLTPRQAEVLSLVASGLSNASIAEELYISEKTASHHVSAILTKLNVSSRLQAAAVATANGWSNRDSAN